MRGVVAAVAAMGVLLTAQTAGAEPVALDCSASGAAGTVSFQFIFDEGLRQASAVWSYGGGRPAAQFFGEAGTDNAMSAEFSPTSIAANFRASMVDDPYAYRVNLDRVSGGMAFIRYPGEGINISNGQCAKSAAPGAAVLNQACCPGICGDVMHTSPVRCAALHDVQCRRLRLASPLRLRRFCK